MGIVKRALATALCAPLVFLPGCALTPAQQASATATVAQDIALEAQALQAALAGVKNVPPGVTTALTDLEKIAQSFPSLTTQAAQQSTVKQVEADVNAVVSTAAGIIPNPILTAAAALLPAIEMGVNLVIGVSAAPGSETPAEARLVLKAEVVGK